MDRIRGSHAMVVAIVALLIAVVGPANAIEPAKIAATKVSRALKLAKKADERSKRALKLARRVGPTGAPGAQGLQGTQGLLGPQGIQGPPGISNVEVVESASSSSSPEILEHSVSCPSGKQLIGGGGAVNGGTPDVALRRSFPSTQTETWRVQGIETDDVVGNWNLFAYAICANVG